MILKELPYTTGIIIQVPNFVRGVYYCAHSYQQWEVIALEQLTSHIEQAHNNRDPSRLQ